MKRQAITVVLAGMLLLPAIAGADIYRWKDANGVINFSNTPPPPGAVAIEKIEETPYDAEADRRRIEEERRLQLERQKLEVEERKADLAAREREAQMKLDEADRRMQEAQELEQEARQRDPEDDCDDAYYLTYGSCGSPGYGYRYYYGRPGSPDLYRRYYRENNSLYYKNPRKPVGPHAKPHPYPPGLKPTPKPESAPHAVKDGKTRPSTEDPFLKGGIAPATRK